MRHQKKKIHLGRTQSHRRELLQQLATSLFLHEKIETTLAKAKAVRPYAEKLITMAKKDSVTARRRASVALAHSNAVKKLFKELGFISLSLLSVIGISISSVFCNICNFLSFIFSPYCFLLFRCSHT